MNDPLRNRWVELWRRLGGRLDPLPLFENLASRYAEPHRAYHNFRHIAQCLAEFDAARHLANDPDAVELAIWYHDVIYDPHAKDNEQQSAILAEETANRVGLPAALRSIVSALILATRHAAPPTDADAALLADVDLSILGQSPERFDEYERQIRQEYDWMDRRAFAAGRSAILKAFLARDSIYSTDFFRSKYEAQARENLARSITRLENEQGQLAR